MYANFNKKHAGKHPKLSIVQVNKLHNNDSK